jgi:hypothetical protein
LKEKFIPFLQTYIEYIIYGLKQTNEDCLLRTSIMSYINFLTALGNKLDAYTDIVIPLIIDILEHETVSQTTKLSSIYCLGDLFTYCPKAFTHISNTMEILLSACEMTAGKSTDSDLQAYLNGIRFASLQTLSSIVISVGENDQRTNFAQYVTKILSYIKLFNMSSDGNELKHLSIALLGDLIIVYQGELRHLIQDRFYTDLIYKLRICNIKKYEKTVEWVDSLIKNIV